MLEFYDDNESRPPEHRERELCSKLPNLIARAMHAPGWAEQLAGVDPGSVTSRVVLAVLPVLRKSNLKERQLANPPFDVERPWAGSSQIVLFPCQGRR